MATLKLFTDLFGSIIVVAMIAVIFGSQQTATIITAFGNAIGGGITAATAPVR